MSHEIKRKEIQIKELQTRLDSGDGCKYKKNRINDSTALCGMSKKRVYENVVFIVVTRAAAIHAVYVILKHLRFSSWLFWR